MTSNKYNILRYYIDLMRDKPYDACGKGLYNVINTMKLTRNNVVCDENFDGLDFGNIPLNGIEFSKDGKYASSFRNCTMHEWNFRSGHSGSVTAVAWSPDGKYVLTGSSDCTAILWEVESGLMVQKFVGHDYRIKHGSFCNFNDLICCTTNAWDHTIKIWDIKTGKCLQTVSEDDGKVAFYSLSSNSRYRLNDTSAVIDKSTEKMIIKLMNDDCGDVAVACSFKNRQCITGSYDGTVRIWDLDTGECVIPLKVHSSKVRAVNYSADNQLFVTASEDKTAKIFDAKERRCTHTLKGHTGWVFSAAFSPNGKYCVTGSADGTARIWNVQDGKCLSILQGYYKDVISFVASSDQYCLIQTSLRIIELWNVQRGRYIRAFKADTYQSNVVWMDLKGLLISSDDWDKLADIETQEVVIRNGSKSYVLRAIGGCTASAKSDSLILECNVQRGNWGGKYSEHKMTMDSPLIVCSRRNDDPDLPEYEFLSSSEKYAQLPFVLHECPTETIIKSFNQSNKGIKKWSVSSLGTEHKRYHQDPLYQARTISYSQDARICLTTEIGSATAEIWDTEAGELLNVLAPPRCSVKLKIHWCYPYCFIVNQNSTLEVWKFDCSNIESEASSELITTLYSIAGMHISNCDFHGVISDEITHTILYQYGAIVGDEGSKL